MALEARYLESVPQTKYLSAENYVSYRAIMRVFYQEHQKMHYQLDKQTIMGELRQDRLFSAYTDQQLSQDLEQLIKWKNLTAIQDPRKVRNVADFQNKQYQYMMSQAALEIERMTITLENLYTHTTGLTSSSFRRIQRALDKIEKLDQMSLKDIGDWWQDLREDFSRLSQSYQDYLREFYGPSAEKYLKSEDFIVYKRHLITYLEDFVQDLQSSSAQISAQLEALSPETTQKLLKLVHQSELDIPRPLSEKTDHWQDELRMKNEGVWQSLTTWFSGSDSTARQVMEVTNEVIRRVVQNAAMLVQMQNMGVSNKAELRHIMKLFSETSSFVAMEDSRFGMLHPRDTALSDAVLMLCTQLRWKINDGIYSREPDDTVWLSIIDFRKEALRCKAQWSGAWGKGLREEPDDSFVEKITKYMFDWMLLEPVDGAILLYPSIGKWNGYYPDDYKQSTQEGKHGTVEDA